MSTVIVSACYIAIVHSSMIDCEKPRMDFRQFYGEYCHRNYPNDPDSEHWAGWKYEPSVSVMKRVTDGVALYSDYVVAYGDKCKKEK